MNTPNCRCHGCQKQTHQSTCGCHCMNGRHNDSFTDRCLCDNQFRVRLSGLRSSMAFRLRQLTGRNVKITLEEGVSVRGKITFVGTDFVEVVTLVKKAKNTKERVRKMYLVQFDQIKWVERIEKR